MKNKNLKINSEATRNIRNKIKRGVLPRSTFKRLDKKITRVKTWLAPSSLDPLKRKVYNREYQTDLMIPLEIEGTMYNAYLAESL